MDLLEATLDLCDKLRPTLGAVDAFGTETSEGEYARMAQRLREAVAKDDDEADEERDRRLSFVSIVVDAPDRCERDAWRRAPARLAAVQRF